MSKTLENRILWILVGGDNSCRVKMRELVELLREVCGEVIEHAADERDKDAVRSPYGIGCNCCEYAYAKLEEICGEEVER